MSPAVVAGSGLPGQGKGTRWRRMGRTRKKGREERGRGGRNYWPAQFLCYLFDSVYVLVVGHLAICSCKYVSTTEVILKSPAVSG